MMTERQIIEIIRRHAYRKEGYAADGQVGAVLALDDEGLAEAAREIAREMETKCASST